MGITPESLAHRVVSAPRLLRQQHRWFLAVGLHGIGSADVVPVDDLGCSADDVVLVEAMDDADEAIKARQIHVVLAVPNGFAHVFCHLALLWGKLCFAERVGADGIEGIP